MGEGHETLIQIGVAIIGLAQLAGLTFLKIGFGKLDKLMETMAEHIADQRVHAQNGVGQRQIDQRFDALHLLVSSLKTDTLRWFETTKSEAMPRSEVEARLRSIEVILSGMKGTR